MAKGNILIVAIIIVAVAFFFYNSYSGDIPTLNPDNHDTQNMEFSSVILRNYDGNIKRINSEDIDSVFSVFGYADASPSCNSNSDCTSRCDGGDDFCESNYRCIDVSEEQSYCSYVGIESIAFGMELTNTGYTDLDLDCSTSGGQGTYINYSNGDICPIQAASDAWRNSLSQSTLTEDSLAIFPVSCGLRYSDSEEYRYTLEPEETINITTGFIPLSSIECNGTLTFNAKIIGYLPDTVFTDNKYSIINIESPRLIISQDPMGLEGSFINLPSYDQCFSHAYTSCGAGQSGEFYVTNALAWYDNCGNIEEISNNCLENWFSDDTFCYQGDVYRSNVGYCTGYMENSYCTTDTDSDGSTSVQIVRIQECGNNGCSNGACL